jgi:16S rRNA (uracil1498-N3)-methyltransferase
LRRRFFVERFDGAAAVLRGESAAHLARVLRAEPGQLYELSDGRTAWLARVESAERDAVRFALVEPLPATEPALRVCLLLSIVKFDRFEWCLEMATELGADEIIPLAAARSDKALVAAAPKRAARWEKVLQQSAQQARRLRAPALGTVAKPDAAFAGVGGADKILLSERSGAPTLRGTLEGIAPAGPRTVVLAIGPEGGWTDGELDAARAAGFREGRLGAHILRTETAVIAALAIVNYALGDSARLL